MPRATTDTSKRRDSQQTRVYRAEKMAQHLLLGDYWTQSMTELQVLELMEQTLNHPSVQARWGDHDAAVSFPTKGNTGWAERGTGRIHLPPGTRNPLTVLHEVAHLLITRTSEADHGPGFVAIYRYLVRIALGEQPAQVLDAAFTSLGVDSDDTQIPPVRAEHVARRHTRKEQDIPGVLPGQAGDAAEVLRLAAYAGLFGEPGEQLRSDAFTLARRLQALENRTSGKRTPPLRIPETVTVPVASLLRTNSRDDVAELVLGAVRKNMTPATLTAPPPARKTKKKTSKKTGTKNTTGAKRAKLKQTRKKTENQ